LAAALQSAHPKIQKMCEEESEDAEAVDKLLEINDSIHRTIERYKLMKAGNIEAANKIEKGTLGTKTGVGKNAANELSLIDFDPEPPAPAEGTSTNGSLLEAGSTPAAQTSVEDDLLGLSLDPGPPGMISLGPTTVTSSAPAMPFGMSSTPASTMFAPVAGPPPPTASHKPNYDAFASLTSALPSSKPATPTPMQQRQPSPSQPALDPFAALVSSGSRPSTPGHQRSVSQPKSGQESLLSLSQNQASAAVPATNNTDGDWDFASSLPELPESNTIQVHSSKIGIQFQVQRKAGQPVISIQARFSNQTSQAVTALHFQVAVEKAYTLQLRPQTGRDMRPNQQNAIQQEILLNGVPPGKGSSVKIRFKVAYQSGGQPVEESGNVPSLEIM
jgi:ADP-ribosylation factor-binding protein GGA